MFGKRQRNQHECPYFQIEFFNRVSLASLEKLVKKINVTRQTIVNLFEFNKD